MLQRVYVVGAATVGVHATHMGTQVEVKDSVIAQTAVNPKYGGFGNGLGAWSGAKALLERVRLTGNHTGGLVCGGAGSSLVVKEVLVDNTGPASDGAWGRSPPRRCSCARCP